MKLLQLWVQLGKIIISDAKEGTKENEVNLSQTKATSS